MRDRLLLAFICVGHGAALVMQLLVHQWVTAIWIVTATVWFFAWRSVQKTARAYRTAYEITCGGVPGGDPDARR